MFSRSEYLSFSYELFELEFDDSLLLFCFISFLSSTFMHDLANGRLGSPMCSLKSLRQSFFIWSTLQIIFHNLLLKLKLGSY